MKKILSLIFLGIVLNTAINAQNHFNYPINKGSITYTMTMMGTDNAMTLYFDNSGNTQCTEIQMEMMGMKMHNRTIIKGTTSYILDMTKKTYTEKELSEEDLDKAGFFMKEEATTEEGVTKVGEEEILGKNCIIYTMDQGGGEVKLWIWKGLMLKMETSAQGMTVSMVATAINETSPDSSVFEVPSDFSKS